MGYYVLCYSYYMEIRSVYYWKIKDKVYVNIFKYKKLFQSYRHVSYFARFSIRYVYELFISQSSWSNIIMTLGVLLIIDYENLARFRFPSFSKMYITLIFYQIVCLFYYGFATFVSVKYLSFHLFPSLCL